MVTSMVVMWMGMAAPALAETGGTDTASVPNDDTAAFTPIVDSDTATVPTGTLIDSGTGDTGTAKGTTPTTGDPTGTDSDTALTTDTESTCPDCVGAAELAGDEGGTPCGDCSTGSAPPWLAMMALLGLARRRR